MWLSLHALAACDSLDTDAFDTAETGDSINYEGARIRPFDVGWRFTVLPNDQTDQLPDSGTSDTD